MTPAISQITAAPIASEMVTGKEEVISCQTGWLFLNEYPRHGGGQYGRRRAAVEVPADEDAPQEVPVLHQDRVVQPELLRDAFERSGAGATAGEQHCRVGAQGLRDHEEDQEGDQADDPQDDD